MHLECQNKYFPYGPKSRLIRSFLYTYPNNINSTSRKLYWVEVLFTVLVCCRVHMLVCTPMYGLSLSQSDQRICSIFQSVYNLLISQGSTSNMKFTVTEYLYIYWHKSGHFSDWIWYDSIECSKMITRKSNNWARLTMRWNFSGIQTHNLQVTSLLL